MVESIESQVARIDERTVAIQMSQTRLLEDFARLREMVESLGQVQESNLNRHWDRIDKEFATKEEVAAIRADVARLWMVGVRREEFAPIKSLVYGIAGVTLGSVLIALLALVLIRAPGAGP